MIKLLNVAQIDELTDDQLLDYHDDLHSFWGLHFEGTRIMRVNDINREDIYNVHQFVLDELIERRLDHMKQDSLDEPLLKQQVIPALLLVPPHGEMIAKRTKTLIVKSERFKKNIGIPVYVFSDKYCWAKIVLAEPYEISLARFRELANRHRITEDERKKWWPKAKTLWAYEFQFIESYDPPIEVDYEPGPQVWVREWKWIGEPPKEILRSSIGYLDYLRQMQLEKIEDIEKYDPSKANDEQLRDDYRIALAWHSTYHRTNGKGIKFGHDEIISLLRKIIKELIKRGPEVIKFDPEGLKPLAKEAWDEATKNIKIPEDMLKSQELREVTARENYDKAEDFVLVPNFVNFVGSQVYGKAKPNDSDILIRAKYDPEYKELTIPSQNLMMKIERMLGPQHWIFEPTGPNWDHVPAYDLVLKKKPEFEKIVMDEAEFRDKYYIQEQQRKVRPLKPFIPMKAKGGYHVGLFTDAEKAWDLWGKGVVATSGYTLTEVKYDGIRFTLHRDGRKVALFTEDMKRDRAKIMPQIVDELLGLKADNFILDCEIVWWKEGRPIPRHEMMAIVVGKEPLEDEDIRANIFDIIYLDGEDLTNIPYAERLKRLDKILPKDLKYLKRVRSIKSTNKTEFIRAHEECLKFPGSEGSMVKDPAGLYDITGKRTGTWIKIKALIEIHAQIIGMYLKPGHWEHKGLKEPTEPIIGDRAYELFERLREDEKTYVFRCAILKEGKLDPILSDRKLAPSDKVLRWVVDGKIDPFTGEKVTVGRGLRGEWRGTEDPKVWKMARGFPKFDPSGYAYGNTYAIRFDPPAKMGDIITVNPAVIRKFRVDEEERYSWIFPAVREIAIAREKPDTERDVDKMIREWEARQRAVRKVIEECKEGLIDFDKMKRLMEELGGEIVNEETGRLDAYSQEILIEGKKKKKKTREEMRREAEKILGDWYMVEAVEKPLKFVYQHHIRGIWPEEQRKELLSRLKKARDNDERETILKEYDAYIMTAPIDEIRRAVERLEERDPAAPATRAINRYLTQEIKGRFNIERVINVGNCHGDWRFEQPPEGKILFGWTMFTPGSIFQRAVDGKFLFPQRDMILENRINENIACAKKAQQPYSWMILVEPGKPHYEAEPGEVGATVETGGLFVFKGSGKYIHGVHKSDYHEYFCFWDKRKELNGRWGFQLIRLPKEFAKVEEEQWFCNRVGEQRPYVLTHDYETEKKKAKEEGIKMIWNEEVTIKALKKLKYPHLDVEKFDIRENYDIISYNCEIIKSDVPHLIYGIVLEPNTIDKQGHRISAEEIEKAMHSFMEGGLINRIDVEHDHQVHPGLKIVESWIAPQDSRIGKRTVKKGSWLIAVKVEEADVWNKIQKGELTGFSIEGRARIL